MLSVQQPLPPTSPGWNPLYSSFNFSSAIGAASPQSQQLLDPPIQQAPPKTSFEYHYPVWLASSRRNVYTREQLQNGLLFGHQLPLTSKLPLPILIRDDLFVIAVVKDKKEQELWNRLFRQYGNVRGLLNCFMKGCSMHPQNWNRRSAAYIHDVRDRWLGADMLEQNRILVGSTATLFVEN